MKNAIDFCTCTDLKCPLHPANHDKGCTLCVAKNLTLGEIPGCFFKKLNPTAKPTDYSFASFADFVNKFGK